MSSKSEYKMISEQACYIWRRVVGMEEWMQCICFSNRACGKLISSTAPYIYKKNSEQETVGHSPYMIWQIFSREGDGAPH